MSNNVALVLYLFVWISFSPSLLNASSNIVATTCDKVKSKELCTSTLGNDPVAKTATNGEVVALKAIENVKQQGLDSYSWINQTVSESSGPTNLDVYKECVTHYGSAMTEITQALQNMQFGRYDIVKGEMNNVISQITNCAKKVEKTQASFERNDKFLQLCELALEVLEVLAPN